MKRPTSKNIEQTYYRDLLFSLLILLTLSVFLVGLAIAKYSHDQSTRYWESYASIFASEVKYPLILHSSIGIANSAANFTDRKNVIAAVVYDENGQQISPNNSSLICHDEKNTWLMELFPSSQDLFCVRQPIYQSINNPSDQTTKNKIGTVELIISQQENAALMNKIWLVLVLFVATVLLAAYYIIRKQSGFLTNTIVQMIKVLRNFKNNEPNNRVTFSGSDDLDQMRDTFNDMLTSIERNEEQLEQAVILKTKELNQALAGSQAANRYKTNIMATVSHEMKNPLHSILFAIELLFEAIPRKQEKYLTYCEHYQRSKLLVHDLVRSIDAILFNAKLSASEYHKNSTRFLFVDLLNECLLNNQVLCQKNQNTMISKGDKSLWVQSDRQLLRYIVDNLLNNAGKFTQGGNIELSWHQSQHSELIIEVKDTGCGMSQQDIEIIFEEFRQIDMSLTRKYQGFGLGLAIVRQSAQLLDGHIAVDSAIGKGTLFKVGLPNPLPLIETGHNAA